MGKRFLALFLLCCVSGIPVTQAAGPVDAKKLDIAGVRLGMSQDEAVSAIAASLGVDKSAAVFARPLRENIVSGKKEPASFVVEHSSGKYTVYLSPNVKEPQKSTTVVDMVKHEMTSTDAEARRARVLEKYGPPSNGGEGASLQWCIQPNANERIGCGDFRGPVLMYSGKILNLNDLSYRHAVAEYMMKKAGGK